MDSYCFVSVDSMQILKSLIYPFEPICRMGWRCAGNASGRSCSSAGNTQVLRYSFCFRLTIFLCASNRIWSILKFNNVIYGEIFWKAFILRLTLLHISLVCHWQFIWRFWGYNTHIDWKYIITSHLLQTEKYWIKTSFRLMSLKLSMICIFVGLSVCSWYFLK
jgi:hypothetical protein